MGLAWALGYLKREVSDRLLRECAAIIPRLESLLRSMDALLAQELAERRRRRRITRNVVK